MAPSTTTPTTDSISDGQLIANVRNGDLDAYDSLHARHIAIAFTWPAATSTTPPTPRHRCRSVPLCPAKPAQGQRAGAQRIVTVMF
jgi:hypothetical protein